MPNVDEPCTGCSQPLGWAFKNWMYDPDDQLWHLSCWQELLKSQSLDLSPRLGDGMNITQEQLEQLEANFTHYKKASPCIDPDCVDWIIPLGDHWLATWNWAVALENEEGINHQEALRVAYSIYFRDNNNEPSSSTFSRQDNYFATTYTTYTSYIEVKHD